jgi:hypothetical protein
MVHSSGETTIQRHEFHSERGVSGYASGSRSREGATPPKRAETNHTRAAMSGSPPRRIPVSVAGESAFWRTVPQAERSMPTVRAVGEYHIQPIHAAGQDPVYDSAVSAGQSSVGVM